VTIKSLKLFWVYIPVMFVIGSSYGFCQTRTVAEIYDQVLTDDEISTSIKLSKSHAVLFNQSFDEQKKIIQIISGWATKNAVNRLDAKYSLEATNPEIAAQWQSMREGMVNQGLLEEIKQIKYNEEWETLLREAVSEVNPSGEILTDQNIEQRVRTVFEREKQRFKNAFPELREDDIYMVLKSYMIQFRKPEDVEEYFRKLPDSFEDMLAGSHEGLAKEIRINKLKERLLFERIGEISYSMFERYLKALEKGKALSLEARREWLTKFLSRFAEYAFQDAIFKELEKNLKMHDKNTENLFWRQYQVPTLEFYIEVLPSEYGK